MTPIRVSVALLLFASGALGQEPQGTITGTLTDSDGVVSDATVEARNTETNEVHQAVSDADGYTLSMLPAGTYEVSVPPLGWRTLRYVQPDVSVLAGETLRLDIELEKGNLGVVGDDAAWLAIRNKYAGLTGPTPRSADGQPDLSGMWQGNFDPNPEAATPLPWAAALEQERKANFQRDHPGALCLPGPFLIAPVLYKFVQTPTLLVQLLEAQPYYRQVFMDGRGHPDDLDPTWTGHSIGNWEGDTLVVDTTGFNDLSWLPNDYPHTERLHVVERYTRTDLAHMNVDVTIEDPDTFSEPWELHMVWELAPDEELMEYVCNENNLYRENISQ